MSLNIFESTLMDKSLKTKKRTQLFAQTKLPTQFGTFDVLIFQEINAPHKEHLAILSGKVKHQENVLLRVHSECFTAEVLGSLKCDCREQLHTALTRIHEEDGAVIYLRQEGRGIGLGNKIKAYALQEDGHDTIDANRILGFEEDQRTYEIAVEIIQELQIRSIRLLTNNPDKISAMEKMGVPLVERVPIFCQPNEHSSDYFSTKYEKMGHLFGADFIKKN